MEDNAILFSYDTRVNSLLFWCVIVISSFVLFAYAAQRHFKLNTKDYMWLLLIVYSIDLLLLTVVFREVPVFPDNFQNTYLADKRELIGNVIAECFVNVMIFIPIGLLLFWLLESHRMLITATMGFLFSLSIETLQFLFNKGVADMEDVICNIIGVIAGYFIGLILSTIRTRCVKTN